MTGTPTRATASASRRLVLLASAGVLFLGGCSATSEEPDQTVAPSETASSLTGELVVYAAASLTESFGEIAAEFGAQNPGVTVTLNFGGSSSLAAGIVSGAPVDVFASANPGTMDAVSDAGLVDDEGIVFARNLLQIAVPAGNPGAVKGLADFADAERTIALCAPEVPCGAAADIVFAAAGVVPAPDTLEQDVRAALTKVELGEVDAAMVYRTDVLAAGDTVEGIDFPEAGDAINDYPIAVLRDAPNDDAAAAFVDLVLSEDGQAILSNAGFQTE